MKNKGITLVALVVTIVIMLILAGVTLNLTLGDNGLFKMTQKAAEAYQVTSEKEYLQQYILSYQLDKATNKTEENQLGIQLANRVSVNDSQWIVIQLLDDTNQIYGDNYNYIKKGTDLKDYGYTKYNWVINYETGEMIDIGEEKKDYVIMSWNSGISVTDNIVLNINPIKMSSQDAWGENVEFCNENGSSNDVSGFNKTEIKFDGVDDYLKLENVEIKESEGFTFEFYCKSYGTTIYPLEKTVTDKKDDRYDKMANRCFRTYLNGVDYNCCFSNKDSKSDKKTDDNNKHWIKFKEVKTDNNFNYISMTVNYNTNTVTVYSKGAEVAKTTCDHEYLKGETLLDKTIPFTIGLYVGGDGPDHLYSKFDLYSCRLYTRVLSNQEIENNFNETTSYHNYLTK